VIAITLSQIEDAIQKLSPNERFWLIERLACGLRQFGQRWESALADMAADPEIHREISAIASDFASSEMDGLEQS
jgi:hypothetical protein